MLIGYIRVSKDEQQTRMQEDALKRAGVEKIFMEKMTSKREDRPQFLAMLEFARPGDTIIVWKLDRLGRTLRHLIDTVQLLQNRKIDFCSLTEKIDTSTAGGTLIFHMFGALAEWERSVISERTQEGLKAARARGKMGGRPRTIPTEKQIEDARKLHEARQLTVSQIMGAVKITRHQFYTYVV